MPEVQTPSRTIDVTRDFNRFYTRVIGLLDRYLVQSAFNLAEARVMYEISQHDGILAGDILDILGLDKGYLSRILDRFSREKLIQKSKSVLDARAIHIFLTAKGWQAFQSLDWAASKQIKDMIGDLGEEQQKELISAMTQIKAILSASKTLTNPPKKMGSPTFGPQLMMSGTQAGVSEASGAKSRSSKKPQSDKDLEVIMAAGVTREDGMALTDQINIEDIHIRTELKPGDLGYLVYLHGHLYGIEYQYGVGFESYVAQGIHEFYQQYDPVKDRVWMCEHRGRIVGSLVLMHRGEHTAQLRYFILEPGYRNLGLGKRLMLLFMDHLKKAGYTKAYLWTTEELSRAAALYRKNGFYLAETKLNSTFGSLVVEQRYDLTMRFAQLR
jgi:DNA-binding MarR family transcriptional regulator/ribosomal protein S18 acetylase RimI-like enzyme